jgi:hypothetical protein
MAVNPCCGKDLQKGTKIIAIVEIVRKSIYSLDA